LEALFRETLSLRPRDPAVLHGLGGALALQDRYDEALAAMRAAVAAAPASALAWHGTGMTLRDMARWDESRTALREAVRLAPNHPEHNESYAYCLMRDGDYAAAWPFFEKRAPKAIGRSLTAPKWNGQPCDGTVLLYAEQGLGDAIQFARFVPQAAKRTRIMLRCAAPLGAIFQGLGAADIVTGENMPPHITKCPLMSLPAVLGVAADAFASPVPYLKADPMRLAVWRSRLADLPGRRIGLAWAGNPDYPGDRRRSIKFGALQALRATPGISFVSLQVGAAARTDSSLFDAAPWLTDFSETAALIAALDLVISVDTSVAHLAGAMGAPVWLLNRLDTDWRWQIASDRSIWYPTMRIFRQSRIGDWSDVLDAVRAAL
jgi:hypothetical protein